VAAKIPVAAKQKNKAANKVDICRVVA